MAEDIRSAEGDGNENADAKKQPVDLRAALEEESRRTGNTVLELLTEQGKGAGVLTEKETDSNTPPNGRDLG